MDTDSALYARLNAYTQGVLRVGGTAVHTSSARRWAKRKASKLARRDAKRALKLGAA